MDEKQLRQIIESLFDLATPGNIKNSLWSAYQQLLSEANPDLVQRYTNIIGRRIQDRIGVGYEALSTKEKLAVREAISNALTGFSLEIAHARAVKEKRENIDE